MNLKVYLQKQIETKYQGTKIVSDYISIIQTVIMSVLSLYLVLYGEYYLSIVVLLLTVLPYLHEAGHYYMARSRGYDVSEIRFLGTGAQCELDKTPPHRDMRDISLAGELMTGVIFISAFYLVLIYAQSIDSPFTILTAIIPCIWIISWLHSGSDMLIAVKAHHYLQAQERRD